MLTSVNGPLGPIKPNTASAPADTVQTNERGRLPAPTGETGPARVEAETVEAIDPARESGRLRDLPKSGGESDNLRDRLPAGPPPAFIETLLQRQAREAFDPQDEQVIRAPEEPGGPRRDAQAGFSDARLATEVPGDTDVDQRS